MARKPKILIVDDRKENLVALRTTLLELDVEVIETLSGNEALEKTLEHEFALAILDVQMAGMDGYELAQLLRGVEETKHLPLIFLSAVFSDEFHIFKGYESGAVDFLTKPFNPRVLLGKVQVFIDLYKQRRQLEKLVEELENTNVKLKMMEGVLLTVRNLEDQINNPLAVISMCTELAMEDISAEKREKYLFQSLENVKRITKHIADIKEMREIKIKETGIGPMLDVFQNKE